MFTSPHLLVSRCFYLDVLGFRFGFDSDTKVINGNLIVLNELEVITIGLCALTIHFR